MGVSYGGGLPVIAGAGCYVAVSEHRADRRQADFETCFVAEHVPGARQREMS